MFAFAHNLHTHTQSQTNIQKCLHKNSNSVWYVICNGLCTKCTRCASVAEKRARKSNDWLVCCCLAIKLVVCVQSQSKSQIRLYLAYKIDAYEVQTERNKNIATYAIFSLLRDYLSLIRNMSLSISVCFARHFGIEAFFTWMMPIFILRFSCNLTCANITDFYQWLQIALSLA